jgi:hypothetical protein
LGFGSFFTFLILYTVGRTPRTWGSARRNSNTQDNTYRINPYTDIYVSSGIWTHDPSFLCTEGSLCHRQQGHCALRLHTMHLEIGV